MTVNKEKINITQKYQYSCLILGSCYCLFFWYVETFINLIAPVVFLLLIFLSIIISRGSQNNSPSVILVLALWAAPVWCIAFSGGLYSPLIIWLVPSSLVANALLSQRWGITLSGLSIIFILVISFFHEFLMPFNEFTNEHYKFLFSVLARTSAIFMLTFYGFILTRSLNDKIKLIIKNEEKVKQSERKIRLYQEQSPIAMIEWNINSQVVEWNKAAEKIFGYAKKEALNLSITDFLVSDDNQLHALDIWNQLSTDSESNLLIYQNQTKDKHIITCEWHNTALSDKHENIIGVTSQILDITEQKRIDIVLQTLAETKRNTDENIFQLIVRQLAQSLGVRYAFIAQFNAENPNIADTLTVWAKDDFSDNFSYALAGTPCEKVTQDGTRIYPDDIQTLFPEDTLLVKMEAVSYFGILLKSIDGTPLGIIAILDDKAAEILPSTSKLIESLAVRAATELERKLSDEKLQFAARIFSETHEGIMITDANATIIDVNPSFSKITGYSKEEAIGKSSNFMSSDKQSKQFYTRMWSALKSQKYWQGELWNRSKSGELYAELLTFSALENDKNEVINYVGLFSDITLSKNHQQSMEHLAHYDMLTGLPNRVLFADRFSQAIARSKRDKSLLAVCFIDLDEFKPVNDTYGHEFGDKVLVEVAHRINKILRSQDTVSRLGGDEFALLLGDVYSIAECEQAIKRIHHTIAQPYLINEKTIIIAASSGVTIYPNDNSDPDTLIRHADNAMYQAKLSGRNQYHLFDASNKQKVIKQHEQLNKIELAFSRHEFCLYYQPKVQMNTGNVYGAEALIRWNHPDKGLIPPLDFLPVIEGTKLEITIGNWVIDESLKQIDLWRKAGINLNVSINISSNHLQCQGFYNQVEKALARHPDIGSKQVQLEILESSVLSDISLITDIIKNCQNKLGISIALDDFGTGYSSLTHLRRIPADTIKIDQTFIRDMLIDKSDHAIVEGIIALAKTFNREVIAEGVETKEHGIKLLALGCYYAQGYGIARPMPAEKLVPWLYEYKPYTEWCELTPH